MPRINPINYRPVTVEEKAIFNKPDCAIVQRDGDAQWSTVVPNGKWGKSDKVLYKVPVWFDFGISADLAKINTKPPPPPVHPSSIPYGMPGDLGKRVYSSDALKQGLLPVSFEIRCLCGCSRKRDFFLYEKGFDILPCPSCGACGYSNSKEK